MAMKRMSRMGCDSLEEDAGSVLGIAWRSEGCLSILPGWCFLL